MHEIKPRCDLAAPLSSSAREGDAPAVVAPGALAATAAAILDRLRTRRPRIHCITNTVAQTFTANMLLAVGAVPSMTVAPDEITAFLARADALLVNLGTLDRERREATQTAIEIAGDQGLPWVLDPAFVDRSEPRAAYAKSLAARTPRVIRLNRAEFATLAGRAPGRETLASYALATLSVIGLTGEVDLVGDGVRVASIANGDALMTRITAIGCAGSALVAAALAVENDPWLATAAALLALGVAGELAAARANGPGSFAVEIVDAVYRLDQKILDARARVR